VREIAEGKARFFIQARTAPVTVSWMAGLDGSAMTPDGTAMIADVMRTLDYAIGRILNAKLPRLKNISGYNRKLILIWSDYFFADAIRIKELLSKWNLTREDVDTLILIDATSKVNWVADPGGVFR
jgi:hypothetical protein